MTEEKETISEYEVYVYDYHGDADQELGDPDALILTVKAGSPERALAIAKLDGEPVDWEIGESDAEFAGYVEFTDVPKDALSIDRKGR
jgi:hypothetical protein